MHLWGVEGFVLPLFVRESRPSLNAWGLLTLTFDTATFCLGLLAVEMRTRVTHDIAVSTGISSFFLAF